jgi:hypothetical protein
MTSLKDCITGRRKIKNNIPVFSSGMMFLVLIKTGQVISKVEIR